MGEKPPIVLHVVVSLAFGGLERLVVEWTNARNRRHPDSTVVCCLDDRGAMAGLVEGRRVLTLHADRSRFPWDTRAVRLLKRVLEGRSDLPDAGVGAGTMEESLPPIDVVHSHNLAAWQYAALASLGVAVKHVHTEHGTNLQFKGFRNRLRNRVLARLTHRLVAVSTHTAQQLARNQRVRPESITVIQNGIHPDTECTAGEREAIRKELGLPTGAFVLGSIGRLDHVKGYDRLIAAFAAMRVKSEARKVKSTEAHDSQCSSPQSSNPPILQSSLLLIGDGSERAALERQARELGIAERVVFAGNRRDARRCLEAMDLFVLPSRSEGLSLALLEAMAAGVPVLATAAGESRAVVEDGAAGALLPTDVGQWGKVIGDRLSVIGGDEARVCVRRARERVRERYSLDATLDAYEQVYEDVLSRGV